MASSSDHIRQWKHNRSLLGIIPPEYPDWLVTVAFYTALQAIDALLAHDKVTRVTTHDARKEVLIDTNRYAGIRLKYFPLYDLSRTVRYMADPSSWIPAGEIDKNVIGRYLHPIEQSVQNLIGRDLGLPRIALAKHGATTTPTTPSS